MTDANMPDFQAGAERAHTLMPPALAGANLIYEAAGMYSSLLGVCPESLILDNDVLGRHPPGSARHRGQRAHAGVRRPRSASAWATRAITWARITPSPSCRASTSTPKSATASAPMVWEASDKPLAIDAAIRTRDHILATYVPSHISRQRSTPKSAPSFRSDLITEDLLQSA